MITEQKLGESGVLDESTAARRGRLLGADALVTGTIASLATRIRINARVIAAESGAVSAVATVTLPLDPETEALLGGRAGSPAREAGRFDGTWQVTYACPEQEAGLAYTLRFFATVKDGVFHGLSGTEGTAPYLSLDGRIEPDGSAVLLGTGLTGDPRYNIKGQPKGRAIHFHLNANFSETRGTGRRVEQRACDALFVRK